MTRSASVPFLLAFAALSAGCASSTPQAMTEQPPIAATLAPVESVNLPAPFEAGGVLRAKTSAVISSRILAPVNRVFVRPGDRVKRGQPLVELDAAELNAQAARARAALAAAREASAAAAADATGAESALVLARATHRRIAALAAERSATPQELDQATADLGGAQARLTAATARVTEAGAALEAATAAAGAAAIAASYAAIGAPFEGVVTERSVDPGTTAAPGMALLVVEEAGPLQLEARMDASRAASVTLQQSVAVRIDNTASAEWTAGRVAEISRIDPEAHSFAIKIDLPRDAGIRSGMFGRARFDGPARQALAAPAAAIVRRGQLTFVFVASDGIARLRAVSVGATASGRAEILDGVAAGELVVVSPPPTLVDGARISATAPGTPSRPGGRP